MCECATYDDGSAYLCPVCADEARDALEAVEWLEKKAEEHGAVLIVLRNVGNYDVRWYGCSPWRARSSLLRYITEARREDA